MFKDVGGMLRFKLGSLINRRHAVLNNACNICAEQCCSVLLIYIIALFVSTLSMYMHNAFLGDLCS